MGIADSLTAQGVKPSGPIGKVVATVMPLLFRSLYASVGALLDVQSGDDVLDVACGSGDFLRKYASHARRIAGIDHSDIQIEMARKQNRKRIDAGTAEFVLGDCAALPWEDDTFSAVTCNCVGCFAQPERSLREMRRVLRPGGRIVVAVDYQPTVESARKSAERWRLPQWTEAGLGRMVEQAGFAEVATSHDRSMSYARAVRE